MLCDVITQHTVSRSWRIIWLESSLLPKERHFLRSLRFQSLADPQEWRIMIVQTLNIGFFIAYNILNNFLFVNFQILIHEYSKASQRFLIRRLSPYFPKSHTNPHFKNGEENSQSLASSGNLIISFKMKKYTEVINNVLQKDIKQHHFNLTELTWLGGLY